MRHPDNIRDVAALHPDYMGFIFYPQSPRFVGPHFTTTDIDRSIERVAVSVDQPHDEVVLQAKQIEASVVQLHGHETTEDCLILKAEGFKLIKVFSVGTDFDFNVTIAYENMVDYFLFDTKGKQPGGNAIVFDWSVLRKYNQKVPFFLSGGLNPENIGQVKDLTAMNIYGIDLNSGVEVSPGLKDKRKIERVKELIERL
jgi:phosphoribosylanthranilate isomerase